MVIECGGNALMVLRRILDILDWTLTPILIDFAIVPTDSIFALIALKASYICVWVY